MTFPGMGGALCLLSVRAAHAVFPFRRGGIKLCESCGKAKGKSTSH